MLCFLKRWIFSGKRNDGILSLFFSHWFLLEWTSGPLTSSSSVSSGIIPASESVLFPSSKSHLLPPNWKNIYKRLIKKKKSCERAYYALDTVSGKTDWYHTRIQFNYMHVVIWSVLLMKQNDIGHWSIRSLGLLTILYIGTIMHIASVGYIVYI